MLCCFVFFFFFKQKTAYEMRISDWSSDVCSSDLHLPGTIGGGVGDDVADGRGLYGLIAVIADRDDVDARVAGIVVVQHIAYRHRLIAGLGERAGRQAEELRSEERRVGKGCVSTCRSRWSPYH